MADIAIFDVDGTLVDTNYQHALAWYRAFRRYDLTFPVWRLHRGIGMGGDQFVPSIAGERVEQEHGSDLRSAWAEEYDAMIGEVVPFEGARELLVEVKRRGFRLVLASSGKAHQVDHYLDLLDGKEIAEAWTTSDDVEQTKPAPDLVKVAIDKVGGGEAVMLGDSPYDCQAAAKLGVATLTLRTGGFSPEELKEAGAAAVYESLVDLRDALDTTALASAKG